MLHGRLTKGFLVLFLQGVSQSCGQIVSQDLSDQDKRSALSLHNKFRSRVASGEEGRGTTGGQPTAANMRELVWDDELAAIAQRWAEQCSFGHDENRDVRRFKVGQNVFETTRSRAQPNSALIRDGVNSWFDEVKDFSNNDIEVYQ